MAGTYIRPGHVVNIKVTAELIKSQPGVLSVAPENRKCLFSAEKHRNTAMFQVYTHENCLFGCKIRKASEACGCVPWNYPSPDGTSICNFLGQSCFEQVLDEVKYGLKVSCQNLF